MYQLKCQAGDAQVFADSLWAIQCVHLTGSGLPTFYSGRRRHYNITSVNVRSAYDRNGPGPDRIRIRH